MNRLRMRAAGVALTVAAMVATEIIAPGRLAWAGAGSPTPEYCQVPEAITYDDSPLPRVAQKFKRTKRMKIVALGSSTTLGSGASAPAAAWPERLAQALAAMFPNAQFEVVNQGRMRQSAQQMLDRLATDVIAQRPDLVIWESGTAEAVRGIEVDQYAAALLAGVDRLTGAGIEVVLMDMQFSRSTARIINFRPYVEAVLQVAGMRDLIVFPRYDVMRWWIENDRIDFDRLTPADTAKIADRVYDCLGWLMAESIGRALREPPR